MEDSVTRFFVEQVYTQEMAQFFNPLIVVATVLAKIDINPYSIKALDIRFLHGDSDFYYNKVFLSIELEYPMPASWIHYMKDKIEYLMKDAFSTSYGKKTTPWYSDYNKEPPFFSKGLDNASK